MVKNSGTISSKSAQIIAYTEIIFTTIEENKRKQNKIHALQLQEKINTNQNKRKTQF